MQLLVSKYHTLTRYAASLPQELDAWIDYVQQDHSLEKNFSQIQIIDQFMRALCAENLSRLSALDIADKTSFLEDSLQLNDEIIKIQMIWSFFRDRLETRFIPFYQHHLLVVDLVSHDCYYTFINRAKTLQIIPEQGFREYPLSGLKAAYSPATWRRHARPSALQNHRLPLPVIDLPWTHVTNPWELLTIAHEVGHDIDQDLGPLTPPLRAAIQTALERNGSSYQHIKNWCAWTNEIFADIAGVMLAGPAFVRVLLELITLPDTYMHAIPADDPHPPHYLRGFINTALLRQLQMSDDADVIEEHWNSLYGDEIHEIFVSYIPEIALVLDVILNAPLDPLTDKHGVRHSLHEFTMFTPANQSVVIETAERFIAEQPIRRRMYIRHLISAAKEASQMLIEAGKEALLPDLAQRVQRVIIEVAPPGQLGGYDTPQAEQRLRQLASNALDTPLSDYGMPD